MTVEEPLTVEDALILLDEFEELVGRLGTGADDPELAEEAERILTSLERLPIASAHLEDRVTEMRSWTEELLESGEAEEEAGPGSVTSLLKSEIFDLKEQVHEAEEL